MIENKHIRSFLRVLDLGGFSRAARSLHIAQPALSQHVRKLEDRLGVVLLERSAHGVTATAAGRQFAARARDILDLVDLAEREFKAGPNALFGDVKLGLPGSVCPILATPVITECARRFPNIKLIVAELMSGDLAEMLRDGRMDVAILFNVSETDDYSAEPIVGETLHLIGPPDDPLLANDVIGARSLSNLDIISPRKPHGLRLLIERWMNDHEITLNIAYEADAPSILVGMSAQSMCYSIVSQSAVANDLNNGRLSSALITDPMLERTACLCGSKRLSADPAREAVLQLVKEVAGKVVIRGEWLGEFLR